MNRRSIDVPSIQGSRRQSVSSLIAETRRSVANLRPNKSMEKLKLDTNLAKVAMKDVKAKRAAIYHERARSSIALKDSLWKK